MGAAPPGVTPQLCLPKTAAVVDGGFFSERIVKGIKGVTKMVYGDTFPASVIGMVDRSRDYSDTVDAADAVEGFEVTRRRSEEKLREKGPGHGIFVGVAATRAVFDAVQRVDGVSSLAVEQDVYPAG